MEEQPRLDTTEKGAEGQAHGVGDREGRVAGGLADGSGREAEIGAGGVVFEAEEPWEDENELEEVRFGPLRTPVWGSLGALWGLFGGISGALFELVRPPGGTKLMECCARHRIFLYRRVRNAARDTGVGCTAQRHAKSLNPKTLNSEPLIAQLQLERQVWDAALRHAESLKRLAITSGEGGSDGLASVGGGGDLRPA